MKRVLLLIFTFILVVSLVACSESKDTSKIGIRGEITKLSQSEDNKIIFVLVEGTLESDTEFDKASVAITGKTKILEKDGEKKLSMEDLKEGMKIEVVMEGPIRESYPVQGDAKEVRVLGTELELNHDKNDKFLSSAPGTFF